MWSDEAATPGGVAYGPTLRPPTLAPFYFGVQGQGSQQGRVGSVLAQGHLPGWMHRTKEVTAKGMQWCGSFKGRSGSMGICSDTRHWGGCTPGRSMFRGAWGLAQATWGTLACWQEVDTQPEAWLKVASPGHGRPGCTGPSAGCFVHIGVCVNLRPAAQLTRKHGSRLSLRCVWKAVSGPRQAEVSRGGGNWQCPQPPSLQPGTSRSGHLLWVNGSLASSIS